ncbi:NUDIX hydrolase [Halorubellus litoreus]|uniref:NUDIX domain-containing protein n=1 Tax=Halorubellus litoreus TaxID=755308 RepID=A0ABD5VMI8_9EURY
MAASTVTPRPTVPASTPTVNPEATTSSRKVCAYVTRNDSELLVFEGPGHEGLQIPKGTVEGSERLDSALLREVHEESGLHPRGAPTRLASDVWMRRNHPPRYYVRHFYHVSVDEPRDAWTHTVTGTGEEAGVEFTYSWVPIDAAADFALDLDDYVPLLRDRL